jgi:hypothetical protein
MATIKAFTDLEQSKKLAEILPSESADMEYLSIKENGLLVGDVPFVKDNSEVEDSAYSYIYDRIFAWSLAALLKTLNFPSLTQNKEDEWEVCVFDHDNDNYIEKTASNPIDACYEMILKLHELNLL